MEGDLKEQRQKFESQSYELELVKNELAQLREANKGLDTTKYSQEKSITEYLLKNQALQRELEDKQVLVAKMTTLVETTKS